MRASSALFVALAGALVACSAPSAPQTSMSAASASQPSAPTTSSTLSTPALTTSSTAEAIGASELAVALSDTGTQAPPAGCTTVVQINKAATDLLLAHAETGPFTQEQVDVIFTAADQVPEQFREGLTATKAQLSALVGKSYKLDDELAAKTKESLIKNLKSYLTCS